MQNYNHKKVESKWKEAWFKDNIYEAVDFSPKPKKYILAEFPYPSGKALHAGHMMRFTVPDVYSRYLRMRGYNVMFPIGWDAFGLPAENYAIQTGINPAVSTKEIIGHYKDSILQMGYSIDWNREINTTDPNYYKWTQWIFLQFYKAGLAEYREMPIWWCEKLKTVLAEEEVLTAKDGSKISERGEYPVEKRMFKQWVLKIPEYAEKLLQGLNTVDFSESIKAAQTNWIGKSEGALVDFEIYDGNNEFLDKIQVFTTRPDTLYGVTFAVLAPEHPFVKKYVDKLANKHEILNYIETTKSKTDIERQANKEKTGVELKGIYLKHPLSEITAQIPVYISDYVLMDYGTGSIMAVPAHDERDKEFAEKFGINIIEVIKDDKMVNSGQYNNMSAEDFKHTIVGRLEEEGKGKSKIIYRIRDWVFSRQRYWGEPIPMIHGHDGLIEPICDPDNPRDVAQKLPLVLPEVPDYTPTADGASPLERNLAWVNILDKRGEPAKRETNTMPNWAGSSWYYIRYCDPKNDTFFADKEKLRYWLPVDKYFGGAEHITLHLLYSRFWHQFLYDKGFVPCPEPYAWRMTGGLLLGPDGKKMSKSRGNVIEPLDIVETHGADALRMFICFLGPYEDTYPWNDNGIKATSRVIGNIYEMKDKVVEGTSSDDLTKSFHKMLKNVTQMFEDLKMNTAVSEIMKFVNDAKRENIIGIDLWKDFIKTISPIAPFIAEELWQEANGYMEWKKENSVHLQEWPEFNSQLVLDDTIVLPIQINGKLRANIEVDRNISENDIKTIALSDDRIKKYTDGHEIKKIIYVNGKILSFVVA